MWSPGLHLLGPQLIHHCRDNAEKWKESTVPEGEKVSTQGPPVCCILAGLPWKGVGSSSEKGMPLGEPSHSLGRSACHQVRLSHYVAPPTFPSEGPARSCHTELRHLYRPVSAVGEDQDGNNLLLSSSHPPGPLTILGLESSISYLLSKCFKH